MSKKDKFFLGDNDAAVIFRENGVPEILIPKPENDDDPVSDSAVYATMVGVLFSPGGKDILRELQEKIIDFLGEEDESEDE